MKRYERDRGKAIHRRTGKTFYYATRLLPATIRDQTYILYGFFRIADEVVDGETTDSPAVQHERLELLRAEALGEQPSSEPVVRAFATLREEEEIPAAEVNAFIDAMQADIDTHRYQTDEDLEAYMRGSAAAVGNMMTAIMGVDDANTRPHAMALGEAFQLTNFLRDVREDIRNLDRVYLPLETLAHYDVDIDDLKTDEATPGLRQAIRSELHRAESKYRDGVAGIEYLPADCQFPVLLAAVLYAEHHRLIRAQDYDVLASPPTLTRRRKVWLVARTWWHWKRLGDPMTVFNRVSAVPEEQETITRPDELDQSVPSND